MYCVESFVGFLSRHSEETNAMTAYIVGLIAGTVVTVFPLVYLMNFQRCLATIIAQQPDFDPARFDPANTVSLVTGVTAVGAVVMMLSIAMIAITGLRQLKPKQGSAKAAGPSKPVLDPEPELDSLAEDAGL